MHVVGIGGGIGASRLWRALQSLSPEIVLTVVVNTADDLWLHGLRICPDLDTVLYALSGRQDTERGWGVRGESWRCREALRELGADPWFGLGDVDLATHLLRTGELHSGARLSAVTRRLAGALGVTSTILPATDQEIGTRVLTREYGALHYEEYLVLHEARPEVLSVETTGIEAARPAPGVLEAIADCDLIVVGPSNPVASVAPVLEVPGMRHALAAAPAQVTAISPIVANVPIIEAGEARRAASRAALLRARGVAADPVGVAAFYHGVCDRYVLDEADADLAGDIGAFGFEVVTAPTLLHCGASPDPLLDAVLGSAQQAAKEGTA